MCIRDSSEKDGARDDPERAQSPKECDGDRCVAVSSGDVLIQGERDAADLNAASESCHGTTEQKDPTRDRRRINSAGASGRGGIRANCANTEADDRAGFENP